MVSLAAIRYSDVFVQDGGPIHALFTGDLQVFGRAFRQANAFLRPEIAIGKGGPMVFGQADGTGVDQDPSVACHIAVSEALERWAFLALQDAAGDGAYGFDVDRTSSGMAAFPGISKKSAQQRALLDAIERHTVVAWWDGRLPGETGHTPLPGVQMVRIHHDAGNAEVVVLARSSRAGHFYGHAVGRTLSEAVDRAAVNLARSEATLVTHRARGALGAAADFRERRALFFSTPAGAEAFERRLQTPPDKPAPEWRVAFNGEIPGPWARWATVWRCAVQMPTDAHLDPTADFFFW